jgi:hypothetical protein
MVKTEFAFFAVVRELGDGEARSAAMAGAELGRGLRWRQRNENLGYEQVG